MPPDNDNPLPRLLDLRLRVRDCEEVEGRKDLRVDLRIHRAEIDASEGTVISVELRKVTLGLGLDGFETLPTSHLGEPVKELEIVGKQVATVKTNIEGKATARAGLDLTQMNPVNLKLTAEAVIGAKATTTYTTKEDITAHLVKARGGDTWEVSEPRKQPGSAPPPLDGSYLVDRVLCKVTPQRGANMKRVVLEAYAKQRDMKLQIESGPLLQTFITVGQEKLFKILVARSLGLVGNKYAGVVKLSRSELEVED